MTIQGRTTPKRGRDRSARWDAHEGNGFRTRSYPHVHSRTAEGQDKVWTALRGRPGAAEQDLHLTRLDTPPTFTLDIETDGWLRQHLRLDERQVLFLRDTLNAWFPEDP